MKQENIEILMDKWMNEPAFREELKANPKDAVKNAGVTLSDDEMQTLNNVDWSLSDEELQSRISKAG